MAWLILVTGLPAAGKTTLSVWLSKQLAIPFINKDAIKEILYDGLGWSDREWSKKLGAASIEIMFYIAQASLMAGRSIILDTPLRPDLASVEISALVRQTHTGTIQIICRADPAVAYQRFEQRAMAGIRHPGHLDMQTLGEAKASFAQNRPLRLDIDGEVIEVDTNDFSTLRYEPVLAQIQSIMGKTPPMSMDLASKIALWADRLRDISAQGLQWAENNYDKTRYRALQDTAMEMYALASGESLEELEPLRATLFSRHTPLTAGEAAVIDPNGKILLMQRADDRTWSLPVGGLEVGETPVEGVVREVLEETGVRCEAVTLVGVFDSRLCGYYSRHHIYILTFLCRPTGDNPSQFQGDETMDIGWFAEGELPEAIHPGHVKRISEAFRIWRGDQRTYFDRGE
jgi:ADP-ribose pyrophosphatase YjhB (NUDIX family)/predicted kinase